MKNNSMGVGLIVATLLSLMHYSQAAPGPKTLYNPKPAKGDLVLPMPNGAEVVFREIRVPGGKEFWGGSDRIIQIGDHNGGMFEGLQRAQINGSFLNDTGEYWVYHLAKYELTKGQFIAVMGMDRFLIASARSADKKIPKLQGKARDKALAIPLSGVRWQDIQDFLAKYNRWLFDQKVPNMPRLDGVPGFIRLPTELEWEYAARGGYHAITTGRFNDPLPFPKSKINSYVWHNGNAKNKPRSIGLRKPNALGLFDLLGSVQEFTSQLFSPEVWQGKPGGITARGGSTYTPKGKIRSSYRQEVGIYSWSPDKKRMSEQRSFTTGLRLLIGSNVVVTPGYWKTMDRGYQAYRGKIRAHMPVGRTLKHPISQGVAAIGQAHAGLDALAKKNKNLSEELNRVKRYIEQAEGKMEQAQKEHARSLAQDALRNASNTGLYIHKAYSLRQKSVGLEKLVASMGSRYQGKLALIQKKIEERQQQAARQYQTYLKRLAELGEYGTVYVGQATRRLAAKDLGKLERVALELLSKQVEQYQQARHIDRKEWWDAFEKTFQKYSN